MSINIEILEKYFKGACTEEEVRQVQAYLAQGDHALLDQWMMRSWREEMGVRTVEAPVVAIPGKRRIQRYGWAAAAAVILIPLIWMVLAPRLSHGPEVVAVHWDTVRNAQTGVLSLKLQDGSIVWLGPHSELAYSARYNDTSRELWLKGQGYFSVASNQARPFIVHTGSIQTRALGTEFEIATANRADGGVVVSLVSGKVGVSNGEARCILLPGQRLIGRRDSGLSAPVAFNTREALDWRQNKLVFSDVALEDVLTCIAARYGIQVRMMPGAPAGARVTASFSALDSPAHVLHILQYIHGFTITEKQGVYLIGPIQ